MKKNQFTDPFAIVIILTMLVCGYIIYSVFFLNAFNIFTSEDQIEDSKQVEFGILSQYL